MEEIKEELRFQFNEYQSNITNNLTLERAILQELNNQELDKNYLKEIRLEFLEFYDAVQFIQNLSSKDRKKASDLKRWDNPYSKDRIETPDGKIEVNLTNPHILEDMDYFRQPALTFQKTERYTHLYPNSNPHSEYSKFWKEEARRCREGLVRPSDGEWIPGYFYFYLNYSVIQKVKKDKSTGLSSRTQDFPNPYDGDYLFFHYLDKARKKGKHTATLKKRGSGFEQPNSEQVLTPKGFVSIGSVKKGDYLISQQGKPTKVLEVFPQGKKDVYEIELKDGRKVKCGLNHLWNVFNTKNKIQTVNTEYLINKGFKTKQGSKSAYKYHLPINEKIWFDSDERLPISPYTLGIMLGDGTINSKGLRLSCNDLEIIHHLKKENKDYEINKINDDEFRYSFKCKNKEYRLTKSFRELNLTNKSTQDKFIPTIYKYSSPKNRLELIKGLMDSDGTSSPNGSVRFTNTSEKLVDDLQWTLRSLGYIVKKSKTNQGGNISTFPNGHSSLQKDCWVLNIITTDELFKLKRKNKNIKNRKYLYNKIAIKNIKKLNYKEESTCFIVDNSDSLYITKDFIVTHNSFKGGSKLARNFILGETQISRKNTKSFAVANEKEYLTKDGILNKYLDIINFCAENTPFPRVREIKDSLNDMEWKMGYKDKSTNRPMGMLNSVMGVTLKNNPHRARGKRGVLIEWEEVGSFTNFLTAWGVARPSVEEDGEVFGLMNAYGTGGEEGVDFEGLEEIFYNPKGYNILDMENVFDKNTNGKTRCAFFFGQYLNANGYYDKDGNSNVIGALIQLLVRRINVKYNTQDPNAIVQEKAERPITPQEAIMRTEGSAFPVAALKDYLESIKPNLKGFLDEHFVGELTYVKGKLEWKPLQNKIPIRKFPMKDKKNLEGAIEIFEMPKRNRDGKIFKNRYIAGADPIDNDYTTNGSLASIFIFDTWTDRIVAEYTGRPVLASEYYDKCIMLCEFYNATLNYENNLKGLFAHFSTQNKLHLLCDTLQYLRDIELVKGDTLGNKSKGTRTVAEVIKLGKTLQRQWMLSQQTIVNEEGEDEIYFNYQKIRSIGYLEECIAWNPDGNFDRVSAMDMVMIYREDFKRKVNQFKEQDNINYNEIDDFIDKNWNKYMGGNSNYNSPLNHIMVERQKYDINT